MSTDTNSKKRFLFGSLLMLSLFLLINPSLVSGAKKNCHPSCLSCGGPRQDQCGTCQQGYFKTDFNHCIEKCEAPLVPTTTKSGVLKCKSSCKSSFLLPNQTCLSSCDTSYNQSTIGGYNLCVPKCPSTYEFWDDVNSRCLKCPEPSTLEKASNGSLKCSSPSCSGWYPIWFKQQAKCVARCPDGWETGSSVQNILFCRHSCPEGQFWSKDYGCKKECLSPNVKVEESGAKLCLEPCNRNDYFLDKKGICRGYCPRGWEPGWRGSCEKLCFDSEYYSELFEEWPKCRKKCPDYLIPTETNYGLFCDMPCKQNEIWFKEQGKCVQKCPQGWKVEKLRTRSGWKDITLPYCKKPCAENKIWWREQDACVDQCGTPWAASKDQNGVDVCVRRCNNNGSQLWLESTQKCVDECPYGWTFSKSGFLLYCKKICSGDKEILYNNNCLLQCPDFAKLSVGKYGLKTCAPQCRKNEVWSKHERKCLEKCPEGWSVLKDPQTNVSYCNPCNDENFFWNNTCVSKCPENLLRDKDEFGVNVCVKTCNSSQYWRNDIKECVKQCPAGWRGANSNTYGKTCEKICPEGKFWIQEKDVCLGSCPLIWVPTRDANGVDICQKPCSGLDLWSKETQKCVSHCPEYLKASVENDVPVCNKPCDDDWFLYWNGGCGAGCPKPFVSYTLNGVKYCDSPCKSTEYLTKYHGCVSYCDDDGLFRYKIDGRNFCVAPCGQQGDDDEVINNDY